MELIKLTADYPIKPFDCGDSDLNGFLFEDAYLSAVPFYEKNDFKMLLSNDENCLTRTMYFDMMKL